MGIEFAGLGVDFHTRGRRIEEQIEVLRMLWTQDVVHFKGRFHDLDGVGINPLPVRRLIPLWMGADTEPAIRRVARLADGFFSHFGPTGEGAALAARFWEWVKESGREPKLVGLECRVVARMADDELSQAADAFRGMGATDLEFNTMRNGFRDPDEHLAAYRRFLRRMRA